MSSSIYLSAGFHSPSAQDLSSIYSTTSTASPDGSLQDGRMVASTKVALVIVPIIFFLLILGFCLVARKHTPKVPVLPVRNIDPTATDKRKSVQRWLDNVSQHRHDMTELRPVNTVRPLYRQPSVWTLSGSTMVGIHQSDLYFPPTLQSPPPIHRIDRSHDPIAVP
ncbi:hypothetical protein NM688_g1845 [Phlebia brevispora]|uniref:Uncharacterized protein n=1 Tax=Phlebia brevispora TaxID=194682 RepID=A0ACC1TAB5_9APHY|nr:hypothetical protein NM688_g1845 [Phlebia brevispora]